jgi:GNAT superfamily N-acetyltransferase
MTSSEIEFSWVTDQCDHRALAEFFCRNVDPPYISHSELQFGRALAIGEWNPALLEMVLNELKEKGHGGLTDGRLNAVVRGSLNGECALLSIVAIDLSVPIPFAVIEDVVVAREARGAGLGTAYLQWLESVASELGVKRIFLESGLGNDKAHHFFEHAGFRQCSMVMMKTIG